MIIQLSTGPQDSTPNQSPSARPYPTQILNYQLKILTTISSCTQSINFNILIQFPQFRFIVHHNFEIMEEEKVNEHGRTAA